MASSPAIGYASRIKPLFREHDRDSMMFRFDLWSYDDVSEHADRILSRLRSGSMPCDDEWPKAQIDLFESWIRGGKKP